MPEDPDARLGGAFYDEPGVFDRYQEHRRWSLNPNVVMEEPALLEELGRVTGLRILDLGCGAATIGPGLLRAGCASYLGIDSSHRMLDAARATLSGCASADVRLGDIQELVLVDASFDLVISRMALHYIERLGDVLHRCHEWLAPGGRLVFTVTHPLVTSHDARVSTEEPRQDWIVDRYFEQGPRDQLWLGGRTVWQHRTIERYVSELRDAGFELINLRECEPRRELFDDAAELARRRRIPLVLLIAGARTRT